MSKRTSEASRGSTWTHPLPPDGFDPRAASPLELRRYGLPPRPDPGVRPELAAVWDDVFSSKLSYITPVFQPVEELVPGIRPGGPRAPGRERHQRHLVGYGNPRPGGRDVRVGLRNVERA